MKTKLYIICLIAFFQETSRAQIMWQINKDTVIAWYLQDGDEFDQQKLDTTKWKYWYGWSRSIFQHKEQQYYTNGNNHELKDGNLNLFAKKEKVERRMVDWLSDTTSIYLGKINTGSNKRRFEYTSGMILSKQTYKYGYFEIKFKMPNEKGYWPAFWLHGGFPNEEIDWMELKTEKKNTNHVGRHSQKREENRLRNFIRKKTWGDWVYFKGNLSENWNIISGEWAPDYLKYYLNGECIAYTKVSLPIEKALCANLAVPGDGPFKPGPDTTIIKSSNFSIDYIRVWSKEQKIGNDNIHRSIKYNDKKKLGRTKLKSKTRFLYGRKKEHINEGLTVTLLPLKNNHYELQVLGKDSPITATYTITDNKQKILLSQILHYDSQIIDISGYSCNYFELNIHYLNQNISYILKKSETNH